MTLIDKNREKLYELLPRVYWAAGKWLEECFEKGYTFRVYEVYRTQERQNDLYAQGRTKDGRIVTWTKNSFHTKRLACDIYPLNGTFKQIAEIGRKYGITHPLPFDLWHFQFDKVPPKPYDLNKEALTKRIQRRIERLKDWINRTSGEIRAMYQRVLARLFRRI